MECCSGVLSRSFDVVFSLVALVLLAVPMAVIAVLVRCDVGAPILFRQDRPGLHGEIFRLCKFRTMRESAGGDGFKVADGERLTRFGEFLRSTSLDELPELWNVFCGDMSLVGPRPLLVEYVDRYTPDQTRRHEVRPGITGLAQVEGRNSTSWERKFELDVWYVENRSFWLDVRILLRTLLHVVRRDGISAPGHATMPEFSGEADSDTPT